MIAATNWAAVSGILASVAAILGTLAKVLVDLRSTKKTVDDVNRRVTTPDTVPGTLAETVASIALKEDHAKGT